MIEFYPHQEKELEETRELNRVAYYHDMGLGKTFVGAEHMYQLGAKMNLVICQKSKVADWLEHFAQYYKECIPCDGTSKKWLDYAMNYCGEWRIVIVINYDLIFRRPELAKLKDFTLMLDESSLIQNEQAKRSKFILNKLHPMNIILLSGTPTAGKYETLWSQLHLLGWNITKDLYWRQYVDYEYMDNEGFPIRIVKGYKNVDRLKSKMREYGCRFLKTDEVFDLPDQIFDDIKIDTTKEYARFKRDKIITVDGAEFVGDTILKRMLYERQLCGSYNPHKLTAFKDLIESTEDRLIVFYNFNDELLKLSEIAREADKPISIINGKQKDLDSFDKFENSVTFAQYQAGAMGLNLQKANKIIYFTPPLSSELFEQSKKRIHRIGQANTCFYYRLICRHSIEGKIYHTLEMRRDYTDKLFEKDEV